MSSTRAIEEAIEDYALRHPEAADGVDGIRQWWLSDHAPRASRQQVDAALEHLVSTGRMEKLVLADGRVIYRRAPGAR